MSNAENTTLLPKAERYFQDVSLNDELSPLVKGPLTTMHLMRWSAAIENWHRIHYDREFAVEHDKLPDLLVNGSLKQQFLSQLVKDYAGTKGWVWKMQFQFRAMDTVGAKLTVWGRVVELMRTETMGLVGVKMGIRNEEGVESAPGSATVAFPLRGGPALPYPFIAPEDRAIETIAVLQNGEDK